MIPDSEPMTIAEAAKWVDRSERTIQRWLSLRLLPGYRTQDGTRVVLTADVVRVERSQRKRLDARKRRRDAMLDQLIG